MVDKTSVAERKEIMVVGGVVGVAAVVLGYESSGGDEVVVPLSKKSDVLDSSSALLFSSVTLPPIPQQS